MTFTVLCSRLSPVASRKNSSTSIVPTAMSTATVVLNVFCSRLDCGHQYHREHEGEDGRQQEIAREVEGVEHGERDERRQHGGGVEALGRDAAQVGEGLRCRRGRLLVHFDLPGERLLRAAVKIRP